MDLTTEGENFIKASYIILNIVPKHLRRLFKQTWDEKHPDKIWNSDEASGNHLYNELSDTFRKNRIKKVYIEKIKKGNEQEWDTTTLAQTFLYSGLNLLPPCRNKHRRTGQLNISEEIDIIRSIRNELFAHLPSMSYSRDDFADFVTDIKCSLRNIFGERAEQEICAVETSPVKIIKYEAFNAIDDQLVEVLRKEECLKKVFETVRDGMSLKITRFECLSISLPFLIGYVGSAIGLAIN